MKKYLTRWNNLTEDQKMLFFSAYVDSLNEDIGLCSQCINPGVEQYKCSKRCSQCWIMHPGAKDGVWCPCDYWEEKDEDRAEPAKIIEYCLVKDGWIKRL